MSDASDLRDLLLPPEVLSRLRHAEVRPRGLVAGRLAGRFRSPIQGFSVEYAGHREYVAGDDARHFDWRVLFRTGRQYTRQYEQETNFTVQALLDVSESMLYPVETPSDWLEVDRKHRPRAKLLHAARLMSVLCSLVTRRRDAFALTTFGATQGSTVLPPSPSPTQVERVIRSLARLTPGPESRLVDALRDLARRAGTREMVVIVSDFVDLDDSIATLLERLRLSRHRVVLVHVMHEDERTLPFDGSTLFEGFENGSRVPCDPPELRRAYQTRLNAYLEWLNTVARKAGAEYWRWVTSEPLHDFLTRFLARR